MHHVALRGGFVERLTLTLVAQQSVTQIISLAMMILVTPKAGAKQELLLNKPASAVLTNSKHQHHLTECHVVDLSKI